MFHAHTPLPAALVTTVSSKPLRALCRAAQTKIQGGATDHPSDKKVLRGHVMLDDDEIDPAKLDVDILFDVPDDALERAAGVAVGQAVTVGYCIQWYPCGWPL
jgi:hypothetical protein